MYLLEEKRLRTLTEISRQLPLEKQKQAIEAWGDSRGYPWEKIYLQFRADVYEKTSDARARDARAALNRAARAIAPRHVVSTPDPLELNGFLPLAPPIAGAGIKAAPPHSDGSKGEYSASGCFGRPAGRHPPREGPQAI